ncbi:MAG: hypothetical protein AB1529_03095 [Candidatus Micrarchaeota archaeon]
MRAAIRRIEGEGEARREFWKGQWGSGYAPDFKYAQVRPLLDRMQLRGTLGERLLDLGSGSVAGRNGKARPLYYPSEGKRVVRVDIGMPYPYSLSGNVLELQADIEHPEPDAFSQKKKLALLARHIGADIRTGPPLFDTFIMVDILNYVDYRRTLSCLLPFLRPGGGWWSAISRAWD